MTPFEEWYEDNKVSISTDIYCYVDNDWGNLVGKVDEDDVKRYLRKAYEAGYKKAIEEDGELWRELLER